MGIETPADFIVQFSKVITSTVEPSTKALQYSVLGIGEFDQLSDGASFDNSDNVGEGTDDAEVFGALGIIGRPLPPETIDGQDMHMEVACLRMSDGLIPIAARDLRLKMQGNGPGEGTFAFIGYGGGFHSMTPVDGGSGGTIHMIYCPFDFDGDGVAQKSHSIALDPTPGNESITIAHADGQAITMFEEQLVLKSPSGASSITLGDDGIIMAANQITMNAGVVIGDALTAVPLLPGVASPPSSKLFVSP